MDSAFHPLVHMISILLMTAAITTGSSAWAHSSAQQPYRLSICEALLSQTALNERQISAVLAATQSADDLDFRVLSKRIGREKYSLVLLGENHQATENDMALGHHVVRQFQRFATENGKTNSNGHSYRYRSLPLAKLLSLPNLILMRTNGRRNESPMQLPKALWHHVENAEEGHQPTIAEELNVLGFAALQGSMYLCLGTCAYTLGNAALTGDMNYTAAAAAAGFLVFVKTVIAPAIHRNMERLPLVANRDQTIARNLDRYITALAHEEQPEFDGYRRDPEHTYLVILGRSHLYNTGNLLVDHYGFVEAILPKNRDRRQP